MGAMTILEPGEIWPWSETGCAAALLSLALVTGAAAGAAGASEDANGLAGTSDEGAGDEEGEVATCVAGGACFAVRQAIPLMRTSSEFRRFAARTQWRNRPGVQERARDVSYLLPPTPKFAVCRSSINITFVLTRESCTSANWTLGRMRWATPANDWNDLNYLRSDPSESLELEIRRKHRPPACLEFRTGRTCPPIKVGPVRF